MNIVSLAGRYALYILFGIIIIEALPLSPAGELKTYLMTNRYLFAEFLGYANWFLPIQEILSTFTAYIGCLAVIQLLMVVGRMTGIFN